MGREVINAVCGSPDMELVGALEKETPQSFLTLPGGGKDVPFGSNAKDLITTVKPDVIVDFSSAQASMSTARIAGETGVNLVIGTTGLSEDNVREIENICRSKGIGAVVASNFALGAVLMIHLAKILAKYFDYAEIIEMHHEKKADAPSGTAITTARAMAEAKGSPFVCPQTQKETLPGTRGGQNNGISIHSVRLPGLMAHQEIILGASGQTLTLRHDTISRECYMPGVLMAVREVVKTKKFINGLDNLLGLQEF